jgi:hypothetical protein
MCKLKTVFTAHLPIILITYPEFWDDKNRTIYQDKKNFSNFIYHLKKRYKFSFVSYPKSTAIHL